MSYADTQVSAARMIADKGQAVTLTPPSSGTYDPATTTISAATISILETVGLVLPLSRGLKNMPGSNIAAGDQQLLLPGNIDQPALDTTARIGGVDYVIKEVSPLNPGGIMQFYDCVIRK